MILRLACLLCRLASAAQTPEAALPAVAKGNDLYFRGRQEEALAAYEQALRRSSRTLEAWLNGAAVFEETAQPKKAAHWYARAAALSPDPAVLNALGWARFRARDYAGARESFGRVLDADAENAYALLGLARIQLEGSDPDAALVFLKRAAASSPLINLTYFFMGKAYETKGEAARSIEAYRQGVTADSYFTEARTALGLGYLRLKSFQEAWRQLTRVLAVDPGNKTVLGLLRSLKPIIPQRADAPALQAPVELLDSAPAARVPLLRVGIGTTPMGRPRPRLTTAFSATTDFLIEDAKSGARLAFGKADEYWTARLKPSAKKPFLELRDPSGRVVLSRRDPVVVRPMTPQTGLLAVAEARLEKAAYAWKLFRGALEISASGRALRLVNILDLENYTNGVLSAEMPIKSPLEALKAQAIVARSHALFIKTVTRRHRKDGYDVCDEQHCQVYAGARAESARSRAVLEDSRGLVVTYQGKLAHVIYSSNCGGHTQSGSELTGWGKVPYWRGVADGARLPETPTSPWLLRRWLTSLPPAYCRPSTYVHPAHFRWSRLISFEELSQRVGRRYKLGRLLSLKPLRRSAAGNVNSLLLRGSLRNVKIDSEIIIRGLLGAGGLRSTLFIFDTEFDKQMRPLRLVFQGGGWGHGVGLCQSGAMGRAEAGEGYEEIIKAYFPGTQLGKAGYSF